MSVEMDASLLPVDWAEALARRGWDQERVDDLVTGSYAVQATVYPRRSDVFRAFHLTRLADVRAVILGQDPYPRPGQADGLAFSVPEGVPIPRSLRTIFSNLENDPSIAFDRPSAGDLTSWARSGVLLLNTALTVEEGVAGSHASRWSALTDTVLEVIAEERPHVAFLLWGSHAHRKASRIPIDEPRHRVISSAHPAAWGKSQATPFRKSAPFSATNDFLGSHQLPPVTWGLAPTS